MPAVAPTTRRRRRRRTATSKPRVLLKEDKLQRTIRTESQTRKEKRKLRNVKEGSSATSSSPGNINRPQHHLLSSDGNDYSLPKLPGTRSNRIHATSSEKSKNSSTKAPTGPALNHKGKSKPRGTKGNHKSKNNNGNKLAALSQPSHHQHQRRHRPPQTARQRRQERVKRRANIPQAIEVRDDSCHSTGTSITEPFTVFSSLAQDPPPTTLNNATQAPITSGRKQQGTAARQAISATSASKSNVTGHVSQATDVVDEPSTIISRDDFAKKRALIAKALSSPSKFKNMVPPQTTTETRNPRPFVEIPTGRTKNQHLPPSTEVLQQDTLSRNNFAKNRALVAKALGSSAMANRSMTPKPTTEIREKVSTVQGTTPKTTTISTPSTGEPIDFATRRSTIADFFGASAKPAKALFPAKSAQVSPKSAATIVSTASVEPNKFDDRRAALAQEGLKGKATKASAPTTIIKTTEVPRELLAWKQSVLKRESASEKHILAPATSETQEKRNNASSSLALLMTPRTKQRRDYVKEHLSVEATPCSPPSSKSTFYEEVVEADFLEEIVEDDVESMVEEVFDKEEAMHLDDGKMDEDYEVMVESIEGLKSKHFVPGNKVFAKKTNPSKIQRSQQHTEPLPVADDALKARTLKSRVKKFEQLLKLSPPRIEEQSAAKPRKLDFGSSGMGLSKLNTLNRIREYEATFGPRLPEEENKHEFKQDDDESSIKNLPKAKALKERYQMALGSPAKARKLPSDHEVIPKLNSLLAQYKQITAPKPESTPLECTPRRISEDGAPKVTPNWIRRRSQSKRTNMAGEIVHPDADVSSRKPTSTRRQIYRLQLTKPDLTLDLTTVEPIVSHFYRHVMMDPELRTYFRKVSAKRLCQEFLLLAQLEVSGVRDHCEKMVHYEMMQKGMKIDNVIILWQSAFEASWITVKESPNLEGSLEEGTRYLVGPNHAITNLRVMNRVYRQEQLESNLKQGTEKRKGLLSRFFTKKDH